METPIGDDEDSNLGDFLEDTSINSPIDDASIRSLKDSTDEILASLTAREAKVLRMRFGIGMNNDHTLERRDSILHLKPRSLETWMFLVEDRL